MNKHDYINDYLAGKHPVEQEQWKLPTVLTDGEIERKEETLNLIGSHSDKFYFHSIGILECDKDLIERSALVGNGYSYFIDNLDNLNKIIISALEKTQSQMSIDCKVGQKNDDINIIQDNIKKFIKLNDYFRHGVIMDYSTDELNLKLNAIKKKKKFLVKILM